MTAERLAEIKARAAKATPPPWMLAPITGEMDEHTAAHGFSREVAVVYRGPGYYVRTAAEVDAASPQDPEFIAHSRQDVDDLVAEVERLREENEDLIAAIGTALAETREPLTLGAVRDARDDLGRVYNAAKRDAALRRRETAGASS